MKILLKIAAFFIAWAIGYFSIQAWREHSARTAFNDQWQEVQSIPFDKREEYVRVESKKRLDSAKSNKDAVEIAAGMYFGWYLRITEGYATECLRHGVDISPFVEKLNSVLHKENARLNFIFSGRDVEIAKARQLILPKLLPDAARELQTMATSENLTMADACRGINIVAEDPDLWSELWVEASPYKMIPEAMKTLMR